MTSERDCEHVNEQTESKEQAQRTHIRTYDEWARNERKGVKEIL